MELNNRTKVGGAILGKGAWGKVFDSCKDDKESLCHLIDVTDKINLYDHNKKTHQIDTAFFIDWLKNKYTKGIAKTFNNLDKFIEEINENSQVIDIYKDRPELITLDTPYINGIKAFGASITKANSTIYVIFGIKCNPNLYLNYLNIIDFLNDVLNSVKIINSNGYYHNDIKLANIIKCNDLFNLIDWGASGYQPPSYKIYYVGGAPILSSPLKLFLTSKRNNFKQFRTYNIPLYVLRLYIQKNRQDYDYVLFSSGSRIYGSEQRSKYLAIKKYLKYQHDIFLSIIKRMSEQQIYDKYKSSFDVYMIGMMLLHIIYKYDMENNNKAKYLFYLVEKFTSLENPLNITEAIEVFNDVKEKLY